MATKVVEADFTDAEELLHEPEYTKDEVEEHFSNLKRVISSALQSEHKQMVNMFLALLKNVIQDAERKGVEVDIDTMAIEDASLLQEVEKLRTGSCLPEQAEMKPSRGKGQLLSIKDEHQNLVRQNSRLDSEVDRLQDRVRRLEAQSSSMVQEKLDLMKQLQRATELAETSVSQADRRAQSKDEDLGAARAALEETKGAYDARTKDMAELLRQTEDLKIQLRDAETENTFPTEPVQASAADAQDAHPEERHHCGPPPQASAL